MADNKKVNNKEIVLRQWFAARYGNQFSPDPNWALPKGIADLMREYGRDNPNLPVSFNFGMYKLREIEIEVRTAGTFKLYDEITATEYITNPREFDDSGSPEIVRHVVAAPVEVKLNVQRMENMEFPTFKDFPTGTVFDRICSDDDTLKGLMSGMVIICTGESGVGKSTVVIDVLAKIKKFSEKRVKDKLQKKPTEALYVSTEMTKTDLYFYMKKMPAIGKLDTLLVADYLKHGLKEAITLAMRSEDHDIIVLDSYQDLVEKMQDTLNWRAKEAENFIIQLMVEAAENQGKCIIAIQHLPKGGEYVGRTFLKHTTTAMLELRFDKGGQRFATFVKNRRAGSMTHIPMYWTMKDGECVFDEAAFTTMITANEVSASVAERQEKLSMNFGEIFDQAKRAGRRDTETADEKESDIDDDLNVEE